MMNSAFDVFISHASEDRERIVHPLTQELASRGISFWVDTAEFEWGDDLVRGINDGMSRSTYTLVILTSNFVMKAWPRREFTSALSVEISKDEARVLPLFAGSEEEIEEMRRQLPLIHGKLFVQWQDNAAEVANKLENLLGRTKRLSAFRSIADEEYAISTAFWAGRYSEAASSAQTSLEIAIRREDFNLAALSLSNLILISRSRSRFGDVITLMRRYFPSIPMRKISKEYRYRLMKELFVYYHETNRFNQALSYLERMEGMDSDLMIYTPSDDWLPGTIRWRKAHLSWIKDGSKVSLANSIAVAQEGVSYLREVLRTNPNAAGLASASLNVGWLYFIDSNPICMDYFDQAISLATSYSPRTRKEAEIAREMAHAKFRLEHPRNSLLAVASLTSELLQEGHTPRNYKFLERDPTWKQFEVFLG
ncbi:toll/interleukin-1 receptor domain-containing protein [Streptomyces sp. NPDC059517]|uniref:toll/interleukin-1 receptor domain-containing protein n=1 Tax=Streptomyces sp. NPDC059517 TaxID=3346855 RepID=UPI003692EEFF